jgi:hypothetical protein
MKLCHIPAALAALAALVGSGAAASATPPAPAGIVCIQDHTPVDGARVVLSLRPGQAGREVQYEYSVLRPGSEVSLTLATDLPCSLAPHAGATVATCHRSAAPGESINSGYDARKVVETSISSDGRLSTREYVDVVVYSPVTMQSEELPYIEAGRLKLRFLASECSWAAQGEAPR